jgi:hypothetical protein
MVGARSIINCGSDPQFIFYRVESAVTLMRKEFALIMKVEPICCGKICAEIRTFSALVLAIAIMQPVD